MSRLHAVGINHTTAPIDVRERLAVPGEQVVESLGHLVQRASLEEVVLLSTCNRVEVYAVHGEGDGDGIVRALAEIRGLDGTALRPHCFVRGGEGAARHIFRVAASLESMVVGEPQILGQVKQAYQTARETGTVGAVLDRCLTMAFRGAKRVRTETDIARGGASVASVAVDLARGIFGDLGGSAVMLVGAGEMARLCAVHLQTAGARDVYVANRGEERGRALAEKVHGQFVAMDELERLLTEVDVVVTSTGAAQPVIRAAAVRKAMRRRRGRPLFFVDIAVPRDVEPAVGGIDGVYRYDVDDLQEILKQNLRGRGDSAAAAGQLVEEELDAFLRWSRGRSVAPVISALQTHGRELAQAEVQRALSKMGDLSPEQREAVERLGHQLVQKLLHKPVSSLRAAAEGDAAKPGGALADAARSLFDVDVESEEE